ncbi:MAG: ABC transporter permease subunit [Proteobacteria bacterium]|nr:ABC transporter permease subunit [Pseudomonadota bacterium]
MTKILAITKKEFNSYFSSPIAYCFTIAFLILSNGIFFYVWLFFLKNQASLRGFFSLLPWLFLFLAPSLTMRAWAEEKKLGTMELMMTLPVRDYEVVLGKFLASLCFLTFTVLLTLPLVFTCFYMGEPDMGPIIGGYCGAVLLGATYLSIGLFVSSLTENQIVAFISGVSICFLLLLIGEEMIISRLPGVLVPLFAYLGLGAHFDSIGRGVLDSRDILYYLSLTGFFLFLNVCTVESRKWK